MKKLAFGLSLVLLGLMFLWFSTHATAQGWRYKYCQGTLMKYNNSGCSGTLAHDGALHMMQYNVDGGAWQDSYEYTDANGDYNFAPPGLSGDHRVGVRAKPQCDDPDHGNCQECDPEYYDYGSSNSNTWDFGTSIHSRYCITPER
jgi:hypothetical protein